MGTSRGTAVEELTAAHARLRADPTVQFDLRPAPPPPEPPDWVKTLGEWLFWALEPVGRFIGWITSLMPDAPYARIVLWTVIALAALALVWLIAERVRHGVWRLPRRRRPTVDLLTDEEEAWQPAAAPARAWLKTADRLAAGGHYAEAVHHLLLKSVEDIARRRPRAVSPARTSRELAREPAVPAPARALFADLAARVEASLFGGRAARAEEWEAARAAYADFALPGSWRA